MSGQQAVPLDVLTEMLRSAASAESVTGLAEEIRGFQNAVWSSEHFPGASQRQEDILHGLAYDLDFFVADEHNRNEDPRISG